MRPATTSQYLGGPVVLTYVFRGKSAIPLDGTPLLLLVIASLTITTVSAGYSLEHARTAIPHFVTEDDEYNGYFIPKNSIVIGNAW